MPTPNFQLLYVESTAASVAFYQKILERAPLESSPNFAMFALSEGNMLGLWALHDVLPSSSAAPGACEMGFTRETDDQVSACHREWAAQGIAILQEPVRLDFGFTFVAADPDGHRLRVFCPGAHG